MMPGCEGNTVCHRRHHHDDHDLTRKKSFRIKQDDKFFSRLLSKEVSQPNSSCRIYYGVAAGAIPFVWESQPGTPKHTLFESSSLPPLTPPPSYSSNATGGSKSTQRSASRRPTFELLMSSIFPRTKAAATARRLSQLSSSFSLSSLSTSSSSSSWSNYSANFSSQTRVSRNVIPFDHGAEDDDDHDSGESPVSGSSPTSTLCFPVVKKTAWRFVAGCYATVNAKNGRIH